MPDQEFKLLITGDATSGVAATQQMGDATKRLKVDCSDLSDETKRSLGLLPPQTDATKKLGDATNETAEKTERGGREMRRLANEVGKMAGVSDLGALTMGKMGAAIFGVSLALELLKSSYENVQEGVKGEIDLNVHDDSAAILGMAKSWDEYATARKKAIEAANTPEMRAGREAKELENKLKLLHEILKAEEAEALAMLATKKDKMSPQAYEQEQNRLRRSFEDKNVSADEMSGYEQIKVKEREAARLEADAASKKAKGKTLTSEKATDAQETAKKNAAAAQKQLEAVQAVLDLIKRYNDPASRTDDGIYSGVTGKAQEAQDVFKLAGLAGADRDIGDLQKDYELQKSQAQVAISLGTQADKKGQTGKELLAEAGKESGTAANLREEIKAALAEFAAQNDATVVTQALAKGATALGEEHAAEGNNTRQGMKDAKGAHQDAVNAVVALNTALKVTKDTHSEAYKAILQALADLQAEDKKMAARIAQAGFNSR